MPRRAAVHAEAQGARREKASKRKRRERAVLRWARKSRMSPFLPCSLEGLDLWNSKGDSSWVEVVPKYSSRTSPA